MANLTNAELYQAILAYQIDEPNVALPFQKRLARENGWTIDFSHHAIEEYKKFIYLCIAAGHPCTPSDEVDQVWHLHMLYTSSYFERLCNQILGKTIAHEPTKGGSHESEKFHDWYAKTLESYRNEFGTEPPTDIWPPAEIRFGHGPQYQRIDVNENIVIPKKRVRQISLATFILAASATIIGCSIENETGSITFDESLKYIAIGAIVLIILYAIFKAIRENAGGNGWGSGGGGGCSTSSCGSDSSGCGSGCGGGCGGGGD